MTHPQVSTATVATINPETGRFDDTLAPPSVAANALVAYNAAVGAAASAAEAKQYVYQVGGSALAAESATEAAASAAAAVVSAATAQTAATAAQTAGGTSVSSQINTAINGLASVARTGSYTDLTNKPAISKAAVGLGSVDNTSDDQKPVSAAQAVALAAVAGRVTTVESAVKALSSTPAAPRTSTGTVRLKMTLTGSGAPVPDTVSAGGATYPLAGVNVPVASAGIVQYSSSYGAAAPTPGSNAAAETVEVTVVNGAVAAVLNRAASTNGPGGARSLTPTPIPANGFLLIGSKVGYAPGTNYINADTFTGSNGSAFPSPNWATGRLAAGAAATIQSNRGQLASGTATGYAGYCGVRYGGSAAVTDFDLLATFNFPSLATDGHLELAGRGDAAMTGQNGYYLIIDPNADTVALVKAVGFNYTSLFSAAVPMNAATDYKVRYQNVGTTVRARVWAAGSSEPASWTVSATDTALTSGLVGVAASGGGAAGFTALIDDVTLTSGSAGSAPQGGGQWLLDHAQLGVSVALTNAARAGNGSGAGGTPTGTWWSGQSDTASTADGSFAAWRGRAIDIVANWAGTQSAAVQAGSSGYNLLAGQQYGTIPRLDFATGGPLKVEGQSWAMAATGGMDAQWTSILTQLKNNWCTGGAAPRPASSCFIRLAHEFNGNWYDWSVHAPDFANFITAWRRFYNLVQSVFPGAKVVWCPNAGTSDGYDVFANCWPGDAYVDVVAVDSYNRDPWINSQAGWDAKINTITGLEKYRLFALAHGKPMAISEWSNAAVPNGGSIGVDGKAGGDAPVFFQLFHDWVAAHAGSGPGNILYEILFNVTGFGDHYEMFPTNQMPLSAAKYQQLW